MKRRCFDKRHRDYPRYGGRGVTVCDRWCASIEAFATDIGPRPSNKHTVDRYPDRRGNYEPGNVRWATQAEQAQNRDPSRSPPRVYARLKPNRDSKHARKHLQRLKKKGLVLVIGPNTSQAIAPHAAERSWVMFVQIAPPMGGGPIKIEGVRGAKIGERLVSISVENPYPSYLIGLLEAPTPHQQAHAIAAQFAAHHMHDGWFEPAPALMQLVQEYGQSALGQLLAQTRPGAVDGQVVDIESLAAILNVSVRTVRRLVENDGIPHMRVGKQLRFVVADVLAAMQMT